MYLYAREAKITDIDKILYFGNKVFETKSKERSDLIVKNPLNCDLIKYVIVNKDKGKIFVAEDYDVKSGILGYCFITVLEIKDHYMYKDMKIIEINDLYVDDKYKVKETEEILFDSVNKYAQDINASYIELNVWDFNYNIKRFYENMGMNTRIYRMEIKKSVNDKWKHNAGKTVA